MSGAHRSAQAIVLEERHEEQWKPEEPPPLNHQPDHTNDVLPPMAIPLTIGLLVVAGLLSAVVILGRYGTSLRVLKARIRLYFKGYAKPGSPEKGSRGKPLRRAKDVEGGKSKGKGGMKKAPPPVDESEDEESEDEESEGEESEDEESEEEESEDGDDSEEEDVDDEEEPPRRSKTKAQPSRAVAPKAKIPAAKPAKQQPSKGKVRSGRR